MKGGKTQTVSDKVKAGGKTAQTDRLNGILAAQGASQSTFATGGTTLSDLKLVQV